MSRYIDADKLQEAFKELHGGKRSLLIDTEPTADVVEVVRCKDCKFYEIYPNGANGDCINKIDAFNTFYPNDFCSFGERKDEGL